MKNIVKPLILLLAIVLLNACTREEAADAYGNFEDDAVVVSAENAGKLINCRIEEGKQFKINDLVAIIDTIPFHLKKQVLLAGMQTIESKADNVEAQRSVLEEQLDNLKVNQKRIRKMYKDGAATKKQLDDINAQVSVTKQKIDNIRVQRNSVLAEKQSLEAQINQTNDMISKCLIRNPVNGTVLISFVKQGEFVAPGKPLYTIQDVSYLTLKAYVTETQLTRIRLNQKVEVEVDALKGTKTLPGTITWISSQAEFTPKQIQTKEERRNLVYAIKVKVANRDGILKIGMPANLNFN